MMVVMMMMMMTEDLCSAQTQPKPQRNQTCLSIIELLLIRPAKQSVMLNWCTQAPTDPRPHSHTPRHTADMAVQDNWCTMSLRASQMRPDYDLMQNKSQWALDGHLWVDIWQIHTASMRPTQTVMCQSYVNKLEQGDHVICRWTALSYHRLWSRIHEGRR